MKKLAYKAYTYAGMFATGATLAMAGAGRAFAANGVGGNDPYQLKINGSTDFNGSGAADDLQGSIGTIAGRAINILLLLAGILAVIYLIWSGFQYITSAGNAEKAKVARQGIINAVIGIVVIVAAFFIVRFAVGIGTTVGGSDSTNVSTQ
ncbi:MAG: hypothetical protein WCO52_00395 [bacterium]